MDKGGGKLQETEEQPRPSLERHSSGGNMGVRESVRVWKFQEGPTYHLHDSENSDRTIKPEKSSCIQGLYRN